MACRTIWADIPPELVEEILGYCDPPSLIILSLVNHQLNSLALPRCFAQQIKGDVIQLPLQTSPDLADQSSGTSILRTAFWLPRTIQHINYRTGIGIIKSFFNRRCRYVDHLRDLTVFIQRMPRLISLRIDSRSSCTPPAFEDPSYHDVWEKLFAVVISKGCEILEVAENADHSLLCTVMPFCSLKSHPRPQLSHLLGRFMTSQYATTTRNQSFDHRFARIVKPQLREIRIGGDQHGNLFPVFYTMLVQHSNSITRLSLMNLGVSYSDSKDLKDMFDHVHFMVLESFTLSNAKLVSHVIFLKFLLHHPTLIDLDLDTGKDLEKPQIWLKKWLPGWYKPKFPNLQKLRMNPEVIQHLVPDFRRCPRLHSVAFPEGRRFNRFYRLAPEVINAVTSILNRLHAFSSITSPLKFGMVLPDRHKVPTPFLGKFGGKHPCWSRVKELKFWILSPFYGVLPEELVSWCSPFPSLECLEIVTEVYISGEEVVELCRHQCANLKSLTVSYRCPGYKDQETWFVQDGSIEQKKDHRHLLGNGPCS